MNMSETYTVTNLAADTGLAANVVRTKLRKLEVQTEQGKYQWTKKADYQMVLKQLKADGGTAEPEKASKKAKKAKKETKDAGAAPENKKGKKKKKKSAD